MTTLKRDENGQCTYECILDDETCEIQEMANAIGGHADKALRVMDSYKGKVITAPHDDILAYWQHVYDTTQRVRQVFYQLYTQTDDGLQWNHLHPELLVEDDD